MLADCALIVMLSDAVTHRYIWADRWDGEASESFAFEERVAARAAASIERSVRTAEIDRACRKDRGELNAWELTMRALPRALSINATSQGEALELLEQAMELAPTDALPIALAAWCHGQRGGHHFTARSIVEKQAARELAGRAAQLNTGDPVATALLASAYTLAHDLTSGRVFISTGRWRSTAHAFGHGIEVAGSVSIAERRPKPSTGSRLRSALPPMTR